MKYEKIASIACQYCWKEVVAAVANSKGEFELDGLSFRLEDGTHFLLHEEPHCPSFEVMEPAAFLRSCRLKIQNKRASA